MEYFVIARAQYKEISWCTLLAARNYARNQMTELILWQNFGKRKMMGFKFLRQHPVFYKIVKDRVEFYIADFYCAELRLVVELDGPVHETSVEYDEERDIKLFSKGLLTIRIKIMNLKE
ncbi:MAG: DUF559 domain-containing protein [Bacteroidetes bacterium]|nr:DUF559 domain-containing protein [Bacteroidota bacterium]